MKNSDLEIFEDRYKTAKATLYSYIGTLGTLSEVDHLLTLENNWGEKHVLSLHSKGTEENALREGLKWSQNQLPKGFPIRYSNNKRVVLNEANAQYIDPTLNESASTYEAGKKYIQNLLG